LFEAIANLVENAIKFTPPGGHVTLRTVAHGQRVGVEVTDTGPGIPEGERAAVLRRFHRVDKSRNAPGCGLGLSLVAAVAKLHGLDFVIEDANPGCRVSLWYADAAGIAADRTELSSELADESPPQARARLA
jgi:signal transduction histidine kinase